MGRADDFKNQPTNVLATGQVNITHIWMGVLTDSHQLLENEDANANAVSSMDLLRPNTQAPSGQETPDVIHTPSNATDKEPHR